MFPAQMREDATKKILDVPAPEKLPPYSTLRTDGGGLLWVVSSVPGDKDTQLRAYRPDGQHVASVIVPVNLNVLEVGTDYVLGVGRTQTVSNNVVMYRLHRTR